VVEKKPPKSPNPQSLPLPPKKEEEKRKSQNTIK